MIELFSANEVYKMQINNAANYIMNNNPDVAGTYPIDIFQFSQILAIVNCKLKEDVLDDILNAQDIILKDTRVKKPIESYYAKRSMVGA